VTHKSLPYLLAAVLACSASLAQNANDKPLTEAELLKQVESLTPASVKAATPAPTIARETISPLAPESLFNNSNSAVTPSPTGAADLAGNQPKSPGTSQSGDQKAKGPTEITALEAVFDQKKNVAVFLGNVVVKDPEFNVTCDKLTAHLKHDEKPLPGAKATPKPATPKPATPAPGATPGQEGGTPVKKKQGGLESAFAERTTEKKVIITQDKVEADGTITHSIGISDTADYNAITGDILLRGMPDVTQGVNRCIATDPSTWMILNRDGKMSAHGPHKTIITDTGDSRATPAPRATPAAQ